MTANECIEVVCYLNPRISRAYLEGLSHEQLGAYVVHLRAIRIMRCNDLAWLRAGAEAWKTRPADAAGGQRAWTAAVSVA